MRFSAPTGGNDGRSAGDGTHEAGGHAPQRPRAYGTGRGGTGREAAVPWPGSTAQVSLGLRRQASQPGMLIGAHSPCAAGHPPAPDPGRVSPSDPSHVPGSARLDEQPLGVPVRDAVKRRQDRIAARSPKRLGLQPRRPPSPKRDACWRTRRSSQPHRRMAVDRDHMVAPGPSWPVSRCSSLAGPRATAILRTRHAARAISVT
jgi:hypothetical protein